MDEDFLQSIDEGARQRLEEAWRDNPPAELADYLPPRSSPLFLATLEEFAHIDLEMRFKRWAQEPSPRDDEFALDSSPGDPPTVESYLQRFPELDTVETKQRLEETYDHLKSLDRPSASAGEEDEPISLDRYRLVGEVGRGGFGVVWQAADARLGRKVAIKQLDSRFRNDCEVKARFLREAQVTARLQHPGIVPLHDVNEPGSDAVFYTMKLVDGETLADVIATHHKTTATDSARMIDQQRLLRTFLSIVQTMEYAHAHGVIHRDLKPQNILVGAFGETIILDWGLAKVLESEHESAGSQGVGSAPGEKREARGGEIDNEIDDKTNGGVAEELDAELTRMGTIQGTPGYMSPEQAHGDNDRVGPASDVFALGCILFQILTGQMPFRGDSAEKVIERIRGHQGEQAPRAVNSRVSAALDAVCRKAMTADPAGRYSSAAELARDLERYLADEPVFAWREPLIWRAGRWIRRRRLLATVVSAAALLVLVTGWVLQDAASKRREREKRHAEELAGQQQRRVDALRIEADASVSLAESELAQGSYASALRLFGKAVDSLDGEPELQSRVRAIQVRRDRIQKVVDFYRLADRAEELVYYERIAEARNLLQLSMSGLGVFEEAQWWDRLPTEDLTLEQCDQLQQDVFRELHLLYALRIFETIENGFKRTRSAESAFAIGRHAARFRPSFSIDSGQKLLAPVVGAAAVTGMPADYPRTAADNLCLGSIMWGFPDDAQSLEAVLLHRFTGIAKPGGAARSMLLRAAQLDPGHYWTQVFLARSHARFSDFTAAQRACERCVALRPDFYFSYLFRASILMMQVQQTRAAGNDAGNHAAGDAETQSLLSLALRDLDAARDLNSESPEVFRRRAYVLSMLPETTPEAIANCIRSIQLSEPNGELTDPHHQKIRKGRTQEFVDYAKRLVESSNEVALARLLQAWTAWSSGEMDLVREYVGEASDAGSDTIDTELLRGLAALADDEWDVAQTAFLAVVEQSPQEYWALDGLGRCALAQKNYRSAEQYFVGAADATEALSLSYRSLLGAIRAALANGDYATAAQTIERLRQQRPGWRPRELRGDVPAEEEAAEPVRRLLEAWRESVAPVLPEADALPRRAALLNGGFELGLATHWGAAPTTRARSTWWNFGSARSSALTTFEDPKEGQRVLYIRHESASAEGSYGECAQLVPVQPGLVYELRGWVRGREVEPESIAICLSDSADVAEFAAPAGNSGWSRFTCRLKPTTPWITVRIRSQGPARVWLDNLELHIADSNLAE